MSEEKRDYVNEAYECFIKNAEGLDPTDPVQAVAAYFERNATDDLKARCKNEGKDAKKCWKFIEAVARKVGGNCHIDPGAVYAIAMHYFEDVPVDWKSGGVKSGGVESDGVKSGGVGSDGVKSGGVESDGVVNRPVGNVDKSVDKPKRSKAKKPAAKVKPKKPKSKQGFFFELLDAPEEEGGAE
jgi:hypothetical protein